ncbi:MAG: hypothetical protein JWL85_1022, partial [Candidatus Saccharibacteria bacterium]|nr:hypothetical protein [Candidatus Saccharibacteria bacterium]
MKWKIARWITVLSLISGVVFLFVLKSPVVSPPAVPSISKNPFKSSVREGQVVANDETVTSSPRQHVADSTAPAPVPKRAAAQKKPRTVVINNKEYPLRTYKPLLTPNDPNASQWWVTNTKLNQAWDTPAGGHQTVLAII